MKANELRIGNWVLNKNGRPIQIMRDMFGVVPLLEPIQLTPEVLEKCGFVPNAIGQLAIEVLGIDTHLELITIDDGYCYVNLNQINEFGNSQNVAIDRIRHIHQLQNLYFALTGEELIYKP